MAAASVISFLLQYRYVAVAAPLFLSAAYLPLPAGLVLVAVGVLASKHLFNIYLVFVIALIADVLGDVIAYGVARRFGKASWRKRYEKKRILVKVEHYMKTHPFVTVTVSRFIGFSAPWVNFLAGYIKMSFPRFLIFDAIGNALCLIAYLAAGYFVGTAWGNLTQLVTIIGASLIVFGLITGGFLYVVEKQKNGD